MAKGQQGTFVSEAEHKVLAHSKTILERLTNTNLSWGAYLAILASGSLATLALRGLELSCPQCGERAMVRYVNPKVEPDGDPGALSPVSSREQP